MSGTADGNQLLAKSDATMFSFLVNDQCHCTLSFYKSNKPHRILQNMEKKALGKNALY